MSHKKTHRTEKPNKCDQCDYESSQAVHLQVHMRTHSAEKLKKCNQYNYASIEVGTL